MSDKLIQKLVEERANTWEQAKAHLDKTSDNYDADAEQTFQRMNDDLSAIDKRIAELTDLAKRNQSAEAVRSEFAAAAAPKAEAEPLGDDAILRSIVAGERRSFEFRDLTKGTATAGGNTVPTSFYGLLQEHLIENSAIRRSNVSVLTTDGGEDLQVPKTTAHPTAGIIAEGGVITESDAAFGQVTLGAFKYAFSTQVSAELEADTGVDLMGYLARIGGEALANGSGEHFITGSGSGQPNGVVTASTAGVTGGTGAAGAFTADNLIDLYYSVIAGYRQRGTWLMSDAGIKAVRKLKDANNQYLWQPGLSVAEESTLLGRPILSDTNVADPALSAKSVAFGDLSRYMIRDVRGVRVERSVDFAFQNDLVTWRFIARTDGDLIDTTGAVKHFVGGAT